MKMVFASCSLDLKSGELICQGQPVKVAPRVFALLHLLAENPDRIVSKDEIVLKVWDGLAISDAAISTSIKEARQAVGDTGRDQKVIRTLHGRGFRMVADVQLETSGPAFVQAHGLSTEINSHASPHFGKPSIAVLPLIALQSPGTADPLGDAIAAELISELSRLRFASIIARGSSFRFRQATPDFTAIQNLLGVRYCLSGTLEHSGSRLSVTVELARMKDSTVIWSDRYSGSLDEMHAFRELVLKEVIGALELQVSKSEADAARARAPEQLDAWAQYHIGLQHIHRYNRRDNLIAAEHFAQAVSLDPNFARAHAGLSFVAFQNAFMGYGTDREADKALALSHAERSLELDALDPFCSYCMARAKWMSNELAASVGWLDRSVAISPNFAQGHYLKSLISALRGESQSVRDGNEIAMALSPLDPFHYAMLGVQTLSYCNDGDFETAGQWGQRSAQAPGAHYLMGQVAAMSLNLAGKAEKARFWAENTKMRRPDITTARFFEAFPFEDHQMRERITRALVDSGFDT